MAADRRAMPLNIDPTLRYVNNAQIGQGEDEFLFALTSGNQVFQFVLSPRHAKRLKLMLEKDLASYEKSYGRLEATLPKRRKKKAEKRTIGFREK